MPLRDAGIAYKPPITAIGLSTKKNTSSGMPRRISRSATKPRPLADERSGREVSRNQEQDPPKVGLDDECKNEQHGER
jgi:hypothetical protein